MESNSKINDNQKVFLGDGNSCSNNILISHKIEETEDSLQLHEESIQLKSILSKTLIKDDQFSNKKITLLKFPGFIHLAFDSLEKLNINSDCTISIEVKIGNFILASPQFNNSNFIKIGQYIKVPLLNKLQGNIRAEILVIQHKNTSSNIIFESHIDFNNDDLEGIHNKLFENKTVLKRRVSIISSLMNIFRPKKEEFPICRYYCSFISNSEFDTPNNAPSSLETLCKWLIFRKFAFELLFEGRANIKSEDDEFHWKRRYIKWFGYAIYVFDIHTNVLINVVDIQDGDPSLELINKDTIIFNIRGKPFEIELETAEEFKKCAEATYKLFPKIINWIQ